MGVAHHEVTRPGKLSTFGIAALTGKLSSRFGYQDLPAGLIRYLTLISVAGPAAAIGWMYVDLDSNRPDRWFLLGILTLLASLAERFPVQLTHKTYVNVATALYVAMLLAIPLPMCGIGALVAITAAQCLRFQSNPGLGLAEPLFNTGQTALYVTGAAIGVSAFDYFVAQTPAIGDISVANLIAASMMLHLMNSALVAGASARHQAVPAIRLWKQNLLIDIGPHAGMTLVGLCAAQLGYASPLLILALVGPAILVHRAVQQSVELRQNVRDALASLVEIVELRDPYTAGHSRRVANLARRIALEMGLTAEEADAIEDAGQVHDLGKVAMDPAILLKPGKLTECEWAEMKRHPVYGADVLRQFESYRAGIPLVRGHHEAWDGSGYPDGLRGTEIALGARILAVADTFDALTSDRPYRSGMDVDRATEILREGSGQQWDAAIVEALLAVVASNRTANPPADAGDRAGIEKTFVSPTSGLTAA